MSGALFKKFLITITSLCFLAFIVYAAIIIGTVLFGWPFNDPESIPNKSDAMALQDYEFKYRDNLIEKGQYIIKQTRSGRIVLGLPDLEDEKNIWILLNPYSEPYVKILPESDKIHICAKDYVDIISSYEVEISVRKYLSTFVVNCEKLEPSK